MYLDSLCKAEMPLHVDLSKERVCSTCWDALEVNGVPRNIQLEGSILSEPHQQPIRRDYVKGQAKLYQFRTDRHEEHKCPVHWDPAQQSREGRTQPAPRYPLCREYFELLNRERWVSVQSARDYLSIALNRVFYKSENTRSDLDYFFVQVRF